MSVPDANIGGTCDPVMLVRWSDDGGYTWSNYREVRVGAMGGYGNLPRMYQLGYGRNRVWEVSFREPIPFSFWGADFSTIKSAN